MLINQTFIGNYCIRSWGHEEDKKHPLPWKRIQFTGSIIGSISFSYFLFFHLEASFFCIFFPFSYFPRCVLQHLFASNFFFFFLLLFSGWFLSIEYVNIKHWATTNSLYIGENYCHALTDLNELFSFSSSLFCCFCCCYQLGHPERILFANVLCAIFFNLKMTNILLELCHLLFREDFVQIDPPPERLPGLN